MRHPDHIEVLVENVPKCLDAHGWTRRDLCAATGLQESNMSRILSKKENLTLERASRFAEALDVPLCELLSAKFEIPSVSH